MLFFVVFGDNVVHWIDGGETSYWFWLLSGEVEALAAYRSEIWRNYADEVQKARDEWDQ